MINPNRAAQPKFDPVVPSFLQEIASAFGAIDGVEAVAWCSSSAMGALEDVTKLSALAGSPRLRSSSISRSC
jgi:hypothetical protein